MGDVEAIAKDAIAQTLWDMAMSGEVAAAIVWLKSQASWTDKPKEKVHSHAQVLVYMPDNQRAVVGCAITLRYFLKLLVNTKCSAYIYSSMKKGSKTGLCRICGILSSLTEDHVPPKGSINPRRVRIKSIIQTIDSVNPKITRLSQNGVKFRTLCPKCNNHRLGRKFDPALNDFSRKVVTLIRSQSRLILPPKVEIQIQPQRVARSVIGHLLATNVRDDISVLPISAPMPDLMRQYVLDETMDFPTNLNIYFWPYPANRQVILRGVGLTIGGQIVVGDFLKYLPVAFWLTHQAPEEVKAVMKNREIPVRECGLYDWRTITIETNRQDTFRPDWPEVVDDDQLMLLDDDTCFIADIS